MKAACQNHTGKILTGNDLRGAEMEGVSEVLQFPVIIEWSRLFSLEPQLL
jgi:hypothetical protein